MSKKRYNDDDGRTIANMDVDGMPGSSFGLFGKKNVNKPDSDIELPDDLKPTKRETLALMLNAALAGLIIGLILAVCGALFILFCEYVWFK